jgi:hypothetical protein
VMAATNADNGKTLALKKTQHVPAADAWKFSHELALSDRAQFGA